MPALDHLERHEEGWDLQIYAEVESTNDLARALPAWTAARADRQTTGRGRHGRKWESGEGGLWFSAVIPAPPPRERWEVLPLTSGWAVIEVLRELGIRTARLRWPNDVMIRDKKLCGLLVERFSEETAVIGVGLNVLNRPALQDASLEGMTTRLADLMPQPPEMDELFLMLLRRLRVMQEVIAEEGWEFYRNKINGCWELNRRVECSLEERSERGIFLGVDAKGDLLLKGNDGKMRTLTASSVRLLREI